MQEKLILWLNASHTLPEPVLQEVVASFEYVAYPKNYMLLKQGQTIRYVWFLARGAVRYFYIDEAGKESNVWFSFDHEPIASNASAHTNYVAHENIQLLEDSELYRIEYNVFQKLVEKHHSFALWYIKILENYYALQVEERLTALQFLNAKQRYERLLSQFPQITNRISLGHIASYLNITQETLSRIRAGKL